MFRAQAQSPASTGKSGAITSIIGVIGTALGIGAAILFTPVLFGWTRPAIMNHLLETWEPRLATVMTWAMAGVEGFVIYGVTRLSFTLLVVLSTAALASRGFPGTRP